MSDEHPCCETLKLINQEILALRSFLSESRHSYLSMHKQFLLSDLDLAMKFDTLITQVIGTRLHEGENG